MRTCNVFGLLKAERPMSWRYAPAMDAAKMNATLALMKPDEVEDAMRFFEICERGGGTPPEEADGWRRTDI